MENTRVHAHTDHERASRARDAAPAQTLEGPELDVQAGLPAGEPLAGPRGVLRLQGIVGNRAVSRLVDGGGPGIVQRHPAGADLLPESATTISEERSDLPPGEGFFDTIMSVFKWFGGGSKEDTSGGGAKATTPEQAKPAEPTPTPTQPTGATTTTETTSAPPTPTPRPSSPYFMELSRAQELLQAQYGGDSRTIVPGNMIVLDDKNAILDKYDEVCIAANLTNPSTGAKWKAGDAKARNPFGLNGFAWQGAVYINRMTTSPTTTIHEMLHLNTAGDFRGKVGETINEGSTQYLTVKTLKAAGVALPSSIPYQAEMDLAEALGKLVSDATLISAYFGGAGSLVTAFETKQGKDTWATFKAKAEARQFEAAAELLKPPTSSTPTPTPTTTGSTG